jgi:hypothetical protein
VDNHLQHKVKPEPEKGPVINCELIFIEKALLYALIKREFVLKSIPPASLHPKVKPEPEKGPNIYQLTSMKGGPGLGQYLRT